MLARRATCMMSQCAVVVADIVRHSPPKYELFSIVTFFILALPDEAPVSSRSSPATPPFASCCHQPLAPLAHCPCRAAVLRCWSNAVHGYTGSGGPVHRSQRSVRVVACFSPATRYSKRRGFGTVLEPFDGTSTSSTLTDRTLFFLPMFSSVASLG